MVSMLWVPMFLAVGVSLGFLLAFWRGQRQVSDLAVELATVRERACRTSDLEKRNEGLLVAQESDQAELLRLSKIEAESSQLLKSTIERLRGVETELVASEATVASQAAQLSEVGERKATLESEVSRMPELERRMDAAQQASANLATELSGLKEALGRSQAELNAEREALLQTRSDLTNTRGELDVTQAAVAQLSVDKTDLATRLDAERQHALEKLQLLNDAKQALTDQFKALAGEILEEKSRKFTEQNQTNLGQILDPLKTKLTEFQAKVDDVYVKDSNDRTALREQVKQLVSLNNALSQDAKNLTLALKGSNKTQGNWGELVLERVLESSGLRKGEEYEIQASHRREDGTRAQPDAVIRLPEDRNLVVDAKVSLVAYEEFSSAEGDEEREAALQRHLTSVRTHIKGLSVRDYHALYGLKSLDFVLMFVPIEPAFMLAVQQDRQLFMDAWEKNVLLVSPSTLMFVVRTVAHLWRQEAQSRNAQEIAKRGAELYDRLCGFVADLEKLGERLKQAQDSYSEAHAKLTRNKGNVIRQAEMLRQLGVKPSKALPTPLVEAAEDTEHEAAVLLSAGAPLATLMKCTA